MVQTHGGCLCAHIPHLADVIIPTYSSRLSLSVYVAKGQQVASTDTSRHCPAQNVM